MPALADHLKPAVPMSAIGGLTYAGVPWEASVALVVLFWGYQPFIGWVSGVKYARGVPGGQLSDSRASQLPDPDLEMQVRLAEARSARSRDHQRGAQLRVSERHGS